MLDYLDFDTSDDDEGNTSFDAMAYAQADRWPALLAEVEQVLDWCTAEFGRPGALDSGRPWGPSGRMVQPFKARADHDAARGGLRVCGPGFCPAAQRALMRNAGRPFIN